MILKSLPLILSAAMAMAAPIVDVTPESEKFLRVPIFNKNRIELSTVHAMDEARWAPLGNLNAHDFAAQADLGYFATPAINELTSYTLVSALGTPNQAIELIFDSGSANLWVQPAYYNPSLSTTHKKLDETFLIEYGSANTSGTYHNDMLTLEGVSISQDFGITDHVAGVSEKTHGIIGVGPNILTEITSEKRIVPTPMDNLLSAGKIKKNIFGVYFERMEEGKHDIRNGEVIFGGYDTSRHSGEIIWADAPTDYPEKAYWGLMFDKVTFGDKDISATSINAISDTGTSLILLSPIYFQVLMSAIPSAVVHKGMVSFPNTSLKSLKNLTFVVKGKELTITPEQYTLRPLDVRMMGGDKTKSYIWVGENKAAPSLGVMLGQKFLEHFYSVYDGETSRVGFAPVKTRTSREPTVPTPEAPIAAPPMPSPTPTPTPTPVKPTVPAPCDKTNLCCRLFGYLNRDYLRTMEPATLSLQRSIYSSATCLFGSALRPQAPEVIFDTGSSILWVQTQFYNSVMSCTHKNLNKPFVMWCGSTQTNGTFHSDKLRLDSVN
ncbi:hypothetical protein BGZ93_008506 [Podila epicladia]|nr:hypothetical protein BGZ92_008877 [Podila epicladia]KAG0092085.1 hypothetical protein BGZ93_008506 [Podila epicladia]